ncbi:hypothetical protein [Sinorhizobium meliloti]|uniref:hypothetical protein n=1 Tax=Rhizobium meliloti TaxID=382 RepID=UPI000FDB8198|nr:hypothetical protein [Sinorhizobium meliloti]RVE87071.1 hypothetical protein CN238_20130 [Sinorhizobium meliloti]
MKLPFFVRMTERSHRDTQEHAAMLMHRLEAIKYHSRLLLDGSAQYAFFAGDDCNSAIILYEQESHEALDWLIKRDPHFAYTQIEVIPTVLTEALVREAQDYLEEEIFSTEEMKTLNFPRREIDPDAEYWFAWKEVPPFSALCPVSVQNDVHRRTVLAQKAHLENFEFADHNPVGRAVGILVAQASLETVREHVESCEVYPDTIVTYQKLWTHKQALEHTRARLTDLRRKVPEDSL